MTYTTTKCRNCGYATRFHESNIPRVQIGSPIQKCPKCGHFILDSIATELEFMEDSERKNFSSSAAVPKGYLVSLIFIIFGTIMLISGISIGEGFYPLSYRYHGETPRHRP